MHVHFHCLTHTQPPVDEAAVGGEGMETGEEEEEEQIPPTPVPKEWECLGSDLEIKETFMESERSLVSGKSLLFKLLYTFFCTKNMRTLDMYPCLSLYCSFTSRHLGSGACLVVLVISQTTQQQSTLRPMLKLPLRRIQILNFIDLKMTLQFR